MATAGALADLGIVKASVASLPDELNTQWRAANWVLENSAVVDGRHLVWVFFVDHTLRSTGACVPGQLTKYTDNEDHALYQAECLKLGTLRHYREQHRDLEGTWDPMEGRSRVASTLEEMCSTAWRARDASWRRPRRDGGHLRDGGHEPHLLHVPVDGARFPTQTCVSAGSWRCIYSSRSSPIACS